MHILENVPCTPQHEKRRLVLLSICRILGTPHVSSSGCDYSFIYLDGDELKEGRQPCGDWSNVYPFPRQPWERNKQTWHDDFSVSLGWWELDRFWKDPTVDVERTEAEYCGHGCSCNPWTSGCVLPSVVRAIYTSVWSSGEEIDTWCLYDTRNKKCYDIEVKTDVSPAGTLVDEHVTVKRGDTYFPSLRASDGVTFNY